MRTGRWTGSSSRAIDGTLGGPDAIFKLIEFYRRELKITTGDKVLFVADGARWIWNRVGALLRRLGVKPDGVNELVDFYHALEHLGKIAALQRRWTAAECAGRGSVASGDAC